MFAATQFVRQTEISYVEPFTDFFKRRNHKVFGVFSSLELVLSLSSSQQPLQSELT